jgi:hypothetical protein
VIVFLWDVPTSGGTARGITDDEARARQAAEAWLRAGADSARVERATLRHGGAWLTDGYHRTGSGWTARARDGRIKWVAFSAAALERAAS